MQTDASCGSCVFYLMDRLELVDGDHSCAFGAGDRADLVDLQLRRSAEAINVDHVLILGSVAMSVMVFVCQDFTLRDGHPAKLAVVSVNRSLLSGRPADGHDLKEFVAIDEIASVEAIAPPDVIVKGFGAKRGCTHVFGNPVFRDEIPLQLA